MRQCVVIASQGRARIFLLFSPPGQSPVFSERCSIVQPTRRGGRWVCSRAHSVEQDRGFAFHVADSAARIATDDHADVVIAGSADIAALVCEKLRAFVGSCSVANWPGMDDVSALTERELLDLLRAGAARHASKEPGYAAEAVNQEDSVMIEQVVQNKGGERWHV